MTDFGPQARWRVHLCQGPNCSGRGSRALLPLLEETVQQAGLAGEVEIIAATCRDRCDIGPSMNVYPGPTFYKLVDETAIERIVREHLVNGTPVDEYIVSAPLIRPTKPVSWSKQREW